MTPRRWARPVTRRKSARQSHKSTEPKAPQVLSLESTVLLHAFRPFEKPGKNSDSKSFGITPHDVANTDKRLRPLTSAPNPIPGAVVPQMPPGSPLLGAIQNTATSGLIIPPTSTPSLFFSKAPLGSFSALPPLTSLIATGPPSVLTQTRISTSPIHSRLVETNATTSATVNTQSAASKVHALNLVVIILLAVGSALVLIGSCILIKLCTRPRSRSRPKPSLPILEDVDPEADFFEPRESPIFGGKERLSPIPYTGGSSWTWVPYSHTSLTQADGLPNNSSGDGIAPGSHGHTEDNQTRVQTTTNEEPPEILTTSCRAAKRQSTSAPSMYSPRGYANVGQAITHDRHQAVFTAVGQDLVTQSRNKFDLKRQSYLGKDEKQRNRESSASTVGLAYDCEDADSPGMLEYTPVDTTPPASHFDGRERIKSGYFATSAYPRMSTMPSASYSIATATRVKVGQRTSLGKEKFANATSKRQRDTQALTYALGLATPEMGSIAPSPQPTLYPDDSMSVVDPKRQKKRNHVESIPDIPVIVPEQSTGQSGLKSMEFSLSQMSFSELTTGTSHGNDIRLSTASLDHIPELQSSSDTGLLQKLDLPPRVPSPPLLPSLAQMALAQHNHEAYTNYRSPTYSLYGLYENPDRRSVIR